MGKSFAERVRSDRADLIAAADLLVVFVHAVDEQLVELMLYPGRRRGDMLDVNERRARGKQIVDLGIDPPFALIRLMMNGES